ncbi:MAG TPA: hypothetical protein VEK11_25020 [Thermoanaerobaculia bacterium]|nr:hypothetical protein [Thermoanaerobaculia bacterium]
MRRSHLTAFALATLVLATTASAARIHNSRKYSDRAPNARAAAGSVSIEARALIDAEGVTTIEVASIGGKLEKVQLKFGKTRVYNNLDTKLFTAPTRTDLERGAPVAIQANVRGDNAKRVEVLNLTTTVRRLPDLAVTKIDAPAEVAAGSAVSLVATVAELNGDIGARASCALLVDGQQADLATNIWVDAGGVVSCLFTTTLAAGSHQLRVAAEDVDPDDWSNANNSATVQVTARAAASEDVWSSTASTQTKRTVATITRSDRPQHPDTTDSTDITDNLAFHATLNRALDLYNVRVRVDEKTDGQLIQSVDRPLIEGYGGPGSQCRMYDGKYTIFTVCPDNGRTVVNVTRGAGAAMYISRGWFEEYDHETGESIYEQYVMEDERTFGNPRRYGNTVQLDVTITDGSTTFTADPYMILHAYEEPETVQRSCRPLNDGLGTMICSEVRTKITGKRGSDESQ